jgi:hypothetical protein
VRPPLTQALDALESMVMQYLAENKDGSYDHQCMSAGEEAARVLARLRPGRWRDEPRALRFVNERNTS